VSRNNDRIPIYAPDGTPRGYRSPEAAQRLVQAGFVTAVYGRKGHLKAIFIRQEDGSSPAEADLPAGRRYSYRQRLDSGFRCWKLKKLDRRDENEEPFGTRAVFLQVVHDCLVR
jgi:hypothetical protein